MEEPHPKSLLTKDTDTILQQKSLTRSIKAKNIERSRRSHTETMSLQPRPAVNTKMCSRCLCILLLLSAFAVSPSYSARTSHLFTGNTASFSMESMRKMVARLLAGEDGVKTDDYEGPTANKAHEPPLFKDVTVIPSGGRRIDSKNP
ncbi:hypothetical protein Droror1_Dr00003229 [Drosera rotundifolia]